MQNAKHKGARTAHLSNDHLATRVKENWIASLVDKVMARSLRFSMGSLVSHNVSEHPPELPIQQRRHQRAEFGGSVGLKSFGIGCSPTYFFNFFDNQPLYFERWTKYLKRLKLPLIYRGEIRCLFRHILRIVFSPWRIIRKYPLHCNQKP